MCVCLCKIARSYSLRVQEIMLMMKHYKKCPSKEESIILQKEQNSEKPQNDKYIAVQ